MHDFKIKLDIILVVISIICLPKLLKCKFQYCDFVLKYFNKKINIIKQLPNIHHFLLIVHRTKEEREHQRFIVEKQKTSLSNVLLT